MRSVGCRVPAKLGRVPAMADGALRAALAAVDAPTEGMRSFQLKAALSRLLGRRRAELTAPKKCAWKGLG